MDCARAIEQVYLYLDGEMPDADCTEVRRHIEECAPCLRAYGLEQAVKSLVARSCGCEDTPPHVRDGVISRLREVRRELTQVEYQPE
jgi:mycothiol system anti-sigma-R factor